MTIDMTRQLPAAPPTPYIKPTLSNTKGGKLYKPTHPDAFKVVFEALPGAKEASGVKETETEGDDGGEEFSSKLVAVKVCLSPFRDAVLFLDVPDVHSALRRIGRSRVS